MIIGEIIFPNNIPNLNQSLFNGVNIFEFNNAKNKNIKEIINGVQRKEILHYGLIITLLVQS